MDVRVFVHATEEEDKVLAALWNVLPSNLQGNVPLKKTNLMGHHGNPITLFEVKVKDKNHIKAFLEHLASRLSSLDKEVLGREIDRHIDGSSLYLRLDKQSAYLNEVKLGTIDPIHFRLRFGKSGAKAIIKACKEIGIIP
jgi:RNA binding exosome subunit